jgi:hypothetical protein
MGKSSRGVAEKSRTLPSVAALEEMEQLLRDLKAERDSLEQRVIWLTSQIREVGEKLGEIHLQRKS